MVWDRVYIKCEKQEKTTPLSFIINQSTGTSITNHYYEYPLAKQHQHRTLLFKEAKWVPLPTSEGELILALRLFSYAPTADIPDLIIDAGEYMAKPRPLSQTPNPSIRKFLTAIGHNQANPCTKKATTGHHEPQHAKNEKMEPIKNGQGHYDTTPHTSHKTLPNNNQGPNPFGLKEPPKQLSTNIAPKDRDNHPSKKAKTDHHHYLQTEPKNKNAAFINAVQTEKHGKDEQTTEAEPEVQNQQTIPNSASVNNNPAQGNRPIQTNSKSNLDLTDLHIRRIIKPDSNDNREADPVFNKIRDGANNIYLKVKEGQLSYYYVLTRNEQVIRTSKCMAILYQELRIFFVHIHNVSEKHRQLYKYLIGTRGTNHWLPLKKYTNVFISSEPVPTKYHYAILSQVTLEPPDNIFA